jgi:hypothetical protein
VAEGSIEIRDLHRNEVSDAIVLARGMRDNPLHVAAYGEDPQRRLRCHARLMGGFFPMSDAQQRSRRSRTRPSLV